MHWDSPWVRHCNKKLAQMPAVGMWKLEYYCSPYLMQTWSEVSFTAGIDFSKTAD
jgi:hypothetical protein